MPRGKPKLTDVESSGFALDDGIRHWIAEKFPRVDPDATLELFIDKALAKGWQYANWPAAFRNYVRNGEKYGGLALRKGMADPAFDPLMQEAKAIGFRMPMRLESAGAYRTALREFDKVSCKRAANALKLGLAVKRVER